LPPGQSGAVSGFWFTFSGHDADITGLSIIELRQTTAPVQIEVGQ